MALLKWNQKLTPLDNEIQQLKRQVISMWEMVLSQLQKAEEALKNMDRDLAREVVLTEKRVNAFELKIDRDCEDIIALFAPVAIDLRFVLAVLKINMNLERTGDIAEGIGKFVMDIPQDFDVRLFEITRVLEMYRQGNEMVIDVMNAFEEEETNLARKVFKKDDLLDEINKNAAGIIADFIKDNPSKIESALYILSTIRKLERVGDQAKNMAEEIIFYSEAKVLKHKPKNKKSEE
ncbi:phosphate signaling complex protein PhoU [Hanamia caeni]|uniref:Phosphate-specific transport system accessory protein PhoU n=1 Tax=Hanamia caeni TaxID=2294116 RepID=A0A3M9ND99_9BACT|nr:phosphate signaling complex protein PhoU [Hanamia caeni]RNI35802.1 phosphate signaling complex protein PhoU [Hanamia caeni]